MKGGRARFPRTAAPNFHPQIQTRTGKGDCYDLHRSFGVIVPNRSRSAAAAGRALIRRSAIKVYFDNTTRACREWRRFVTCPSVRLSARSLPLPVKYVNKHRIVTANAYHVDMQRKTDGRGRHNYWRAQTENEITRSFFYKGCWIFLTSLVP